MDDGDSSEPVDEESDVDSYLSLYDSDSQNSCYGSDENLFKNIDWSSSESENGLEDEVKKKQEDFCRTLGHWVVESNIPRVHVGKRRLCNAPAAAPPSSRWPPPLTSRPDVTTRRHDRHRGRHHHSVTPDVTRELQGGSSSRVVPGWHSKSFQVGAASRSGLAWQVVSSLQVLTGANLSAPCILSATALPPSKSLECMPAGGETPLNPMIFPEPSDYTGLAKVRQHATIPALAETNPEMAPEIIDEAPSIRLYT
ncbi:hypothetical protein DAPPUDRAFT_259574 [Daphnia pulex]|uniref:Uncharacterized protein n=1 Tax=Daphnia pulex TaxID=6669 RepID=E9HHF8_DAPPU|nr:hypothetical protein DAPPUDRAFT_259574 [Daphnia pulex]|eukprot:EFX68822.1 hypothetical protein DAPPUDRAFT_259574 [Daphnia pulex]